MIQRRLVIAAAVLALGVLLLNTLFRPQPDAPVPGFSSRDYYQIEPRTTLPQQSSPRRKQPFFKDDYIITPLADFSMSARVLGTERYYLGREAEISPVDLALGWGRMADPGVLETISIRQSGRWYYWNTPQYPIPRHEIETHSANMHMVPANDSVRERLLAVDKDDEVFLTGQLVRIDAKDGWHWVSSLSRDDTGDGACEIVYVQDILVQ